MLFRTAAAAVAIAGVLVVGGAGNASAMGWLSASFAPAISGIIRAANADNPYGNVDRRNDSGNDTGDSRVDGLNAGQLDRNYRGPTYQPGQAPPQPGSVTPSPAQGTSPAPAGAAAPR